VTFYIALIYESTALNLLAIIEAVFAVLAFACVFYRTRHLRAVLQIPISIADKNSPVNVGVELENDTKMTCLRVKLRIGVARSGDITRSRWLKMENVLPGTSGYHFPISMDEPGCYEFTARKLRVYDMTGLIHLDVKLQSFGRILVLPEMREIPVRLSESTRNFFGDAEVYDELRPGYDPSETFDVRQFRNGDKLQSIHWKLSVKMDDLVVRERSLPKGCPVVLFLDASGGDPDFFVWVSAISFSLMDAGCPHFAVWYSKRQNDILRARVDDEESFYLFLTTYLEDGENEYGPELTERYREKYRGQQYLHALYLNGKPELYLDGERLQPLEFDKIQLLL
jgi:uncharacterized protein (DUF58 family)